jgi:hypothetical protein
MNTKFLILIFVLYSMNAKAVKVLKISMRHVAKIKDEDGKTLSTDGVWEWYYSANHSIIKSKGMGNPTFDLKTAAPGGTPEEEAKAQEMLEKIETWSITDLEKMEQLSITRMPDMNPQNAGKMINVCNRFPLKALMKGAQKNKTDFSQTTKATGKTATINGFPSEEYVSQIKSADLTMDNVVWYHFSPKGKMVVDFYDNYARKLGSVLQGDQFVNAEILAKSKDGVLFTKMTGKSTNKKKEGQMLTGMQIQEVKEVNIDLQKILNPTCSSPWGMVFPNGVGGEIRKSAQGQAKDSAAGAVKGALKGLFGN